MAYENGYDHDPGQLAPPPSYASLSSPLVPQQGFEHASAQTDTTPVHPAFDHAYGDSLHLPRGCFLVRNAAQGKALDLLRHRLDEGAELGLHPVKQPQLKGLSLQHAGNNQLFFLSWDGHLVSAAASREIDVQDNRLVLTVPHPITTYASSLSHPAPRFRLDPSTSTLHVIYLHDPSFTGPDGSSDWRDDDYIVEAVPLKRKPAEPPMWATTQANHLLSAVGSRAVHLGARVGDLLGRRFSQPSSPNPDGAHSRRGDPDELPLPPPPPPDKPTPEKEVPPVPSTSRLPEPNVTRPTSSPLPTPPEEEEEEEEAEEGSVGAAGAAAAAASEDDSDSDSEPGAYRPVRVVRLPPNWRDKFPAAALRTAPNTSFGVTRWPASAKELRTWRRRQWDVVPVTVRPLPRSTTAAAGATGAEEEGYVLPSPQGSDSFPRSRSDSMSYFSGAGGDSTHGSGNGGRAELLYDSAADDHDDDDADAAEIHSTDFSPLAMSATEDLPPPPASPTRATLDALGRRASLAAADPRLSGLLLGGGGGAGGDGRASTASTRSDEASLSRAARGSYSESPRPLPLPPSPPLPSVPFGSDVPVSSAAADNSRPVTPEAQRGGPGANDGDDDGDDEAEMRTPRPDHHDTASGSPPWGRSAMDAASRQPEQEEEEEQSPDSPLTGKGSSRLGSVELVEQKSEAAQEGAESAPNATAQEELDQESQGRLGETSEAPGGVVEE